MKIQCLHLDFPINIKTNKSHQYCLQSLNIVCLWKGKIFQVNLHLWIYGTLFGGLFEPVLTHTMLNYTMLNCNIDTEKKRQQCRIVLGRDTCQTARVTDFNQWRSELFP